MEKLLFIHGFNSNGNAVKAQVMQRCLTDYETISPTIDYYKLTPKEVMQQLGGLIRQHHPLLTVGSSLGGYYSIACSAAFGIPVLAINPTTEPMAVKKVPLGKVPFLASLAVAINNKPERGERKNLAKDFALGEKIIEAYKRFQTEVFDKAIPEGKNLNFALATDDELLGSHRYLEEKYPQHNKILYHDDCGHHFTQFESIIPWVKELIEEYR